jgi:hypothetical protein
MGNYGEASVTWQGTGLQLLDIQRQAALSVLQRCLTVQ